MKAGFVEAIKSNMNGSVIPGASMSSYTTYRTGGEAEVLVIPDNSHELERICRFAGREKIPFIIIGAGSNIIAADSGVEGMVVCTKAGTAVMDIAADGAVVADSGVMLEDLIRRCAFRGFGGLDGVAGIPGTIGGAVVMNAGTDEGNISDYIESVETISCSGGTELIGRAGLDFGYRRSVFSGTGRIALRTRFRLPRGEGGKIIANLDRVWRERARKFPLDLPNAGSVFRRPEGDFAGRLIEKAGCKGMKVGGAMVSERHANFIVNTGGATSSEITELIRRVRARVLETTGMDLELEQVLL